MIFNFSVSAISVVTGAWKAEGQINVPVNIDQRRPKPLTRVPVSTCCSIHLQAVG
jgi:hypothetical protein